MSSDLSELTLPAALEAAHEAAQAAGLPYAGGVPPQAAWNLFSAGDALLVDVRTAEERKFVGHVPGSPHVAWASDTAMTRNPRFVRELEGFEGEIDAQRRRLRRLAPPRPAVGAGLNMVPPRLLRSLPREGASVPLGRPCGHRGT